MTTTTTSIATAATELCPACLTELPADYPYDHVAIDAALGGRRVKLAGNAEKAEAVRIGMARGRSLTWVAARLRLTYTDARQLDGVAELQQAALDHRDAEVARLAVAGHTAYTIANLTGYARATVHRSMERQGLGQYRTTDCGHVWPPELDADAACLRCGLAYPEWSRDGVAA